MSMELSLFKISRSFSHIPDFSLISTLTQATICLNQVFSFRSRASRKAYLENRYFKREQIQNNFSFNVNSALTINFRGWDGRFGRRFSILRVKWPIFSTTDIFASNCLPVNFSKQKWETIFRKKFQRSSSEKRR